MTDDRALCTSIDGSKTDSIYFISCQIVCGRQIVSFSYFTLDENPFKGVQGKVDDAQY